MMKGRITTYRFNANGALVYDPDKSITIDYADSGSPIKITFDTGNTTEYVYTADGKKLKTIWRSCQAQCREVSFEDDEDGYAGLGFVGGSQGVAAGGSVTNSREYAGPFIIDDGSVSRFLFDGGYCTLDGNGTAYHFYIKDHLGSNRVVMSENGTVEQKNHYYPFGGVYGDISTGYDVQGFKFNGKELDGRHGLTLYDYGARMYDPAIARWTSVDPLCEKYYSISPYAYCADNPVKFIGQDGKETHVAMNTNGTYSIIGGVLNKDRNIYLYSRDCYGYYSIRRGSIGITSSTTSFYNSDFNGGQGAWMIGAIIDPMDNSGKIFLNIMASMDITLDDYIDKARNGHPYDFKVTNGSENVISKTPNFIYRGMSIGTTVFGQTIYSSARDIGNMAAGIVAAKNGLPWLFARIAFDAYQSRHGFQHEGISTTNAEYYGWSQMYSRSNGMIEATNLRKSINSVLGKIWNLLFK